MNRVKVRRVIRPDAPLPEAFRRSYLPAPRPPVRFGRVLLLLVLAAALIVLLRVLR